MTYYHPPDAMPHLTHFTPMEKSAWCWIFSRPVISLSGRQKLIDGTEVDIGAGSTMSESVRGVPSFATHLEANAWAERNGFEYAYSELP